MATKKFKLLENYRTETYTDENGKQKKRAVYAGKYIRFWGEQSELKTKFILFWVLGAAIVASCIAQLFLRHSMVGTYLENVVSVPQIIALFPSLYMIMGLYYVPREPKTMQYDTFAKGIGRIKNSSIAIAILSALTLIGYIVLCFILGSAFATADIVLLALLALSLACCAVVIKGISSLQTEETDSNII